jgi:hypothetical protein
MRIIVSPFATIIANPAAKSNESKKNLGKSAFLKKSRGNPEKKRLYI